MLPDTSIHRPLFARFYEWVSPGMEAAGMVDHRRELLAGLRGEVIEVGAGNGLNFSHYPDTVSRVTAVEPEPYLRERATARTIGAPVPVEVVAGTAERLPAGDAAVDAVVVSLVLCSLGDPGVAVAEMARVLRPGGQVRFLEHVRADTPGMARVQRLLDATVWPRVAGGCHASRDPVALFEAAGFDMARLRRMRFPDGRVPFPTAPHVLGVALRPGAP